MSTFDSEDAKLVTLARATMSRTGAGQAAAIRDTDGRTYAAAAVALPSLRLSALQVAVAMALAAAAPGIEAAVVFGGEPADPAGVSAVHELTPDAPVHFVDRRGQPVTG
ncbi:MAG TPA: cytidine deaminase [Jatrophihabitans sp.]|nr:cytidine deaminase [Jatrophihabitans sp.]